MLMENYHISKEVETSDTLVCVFIYLILYHPLNNLIAIYLPTSTRNLALPREPLCFTTLCKKAQETRFVLPCGRLREDSRRPHEGGFLCCDGEWLRDEEG